MSISIDQKLVDTVRAIAERAGEAILEVYGTDFDVARKDDASPVTEADERAERLIIDAIRAEIGDIYPIVAEEAVAGGDIPVVGERPFWLVDPLDGTKQFVKRQGEFTVNIALIEDRRPLLGVVHAPALSATYWGSPLGAFAADNGAEAHAIACRPLPAHGVIAVASRSHRNAETDAFLARYDLAELDLGGQLDQVLPRRGRQGRCLPAHRPDHGMGHRRRPRSRPLRRRNGERSGRPRTAVRQARVRESPLRRERPAGDVSAAPIVAASPEAVREAARIIQAGGLVAFPTETVYGLGGDAANDRAIAAIFAAKDRPRFNPLICHVLDGEGAAALVRLNGAARALIARFWPGALTLVLPRRNDAPLSLLVTAGLDTVAVRAPDHPLARALIAAAGVPIAAPSANRSSTLSPTTAAHVAAGLGDRVTMILDGGACRVGVEFDDRRPERAAADTAPARRGAGRDARSCRRTARHCRR